MGVNIYSELVMRIDISVKTGGSYACYLAYGTFAIDKFGDEIFKRVGYIGNPKDAPQGVKIERKSDGKYGGAQHYYDYILEVAEDFKYFICEIGSGKQMGKHRKILFTPLEHRKESAQVEALENLLEQTAPIDSETIASLKNSLDLPDAIAPEIPTVAKQLELVPELPQVDRREWIDPNLINLESGTQTRRQSPEKIADYAEMMRSGEWDWTRSDIVIYENDNGAFPSDGHHRIEAAIMAEVQIFAEVKKGSLRDAIFESFASNKFHGLPLSREDKNNRVRAILLDDEWQQMSDRAIATHCGVSTPFVGKIRAELVAEKTITPTVQRIGRDGRSQASRKVKPVLVESDVLVENDPNNSLPEQTAIAPLESLPEQIIPIPEYIADDIKKPVAIVPIADDSALETAKRIADKLTYNQLVELEKYVANLLPEY